MATPTKTTTVTRFGGTAIEGLVNDQVVERIEEFAAIHSVELTQSAKGLWRVAGIKIYGTDPMAIASQAALVAHSATKALKDTGLPMEAGK